MPPEPWQSQDIRLGADGINLHLAGDLVPPTQLTRMTNLTRNRQGGIESRPGMRYFTGASDYTLDHHSMIRLDGGIPEVSATFHRFVGAGTNVYHGKNSVPLNLLSSGWSGHPLTFLNFRPRSAGRDWTLIADTAKVRQVKKTGAETATEYQLGMPKPNQPSVSVQAPEETVIDNMGSAGWTNNQGTAEGPPLNSVAPGLEGDATAFTTTGSGEPGKGYYQYWGKANSVDLSRVGSRAAADEDHIQFFMMIDFPARVSEIKIYFVLGDFDPTKLPGDDETENGNAYVKGFRPADFANAVIQTDSFTDAGRQRRAADILEKGLKISTLEDDRGGDIAVRKEQREAKRYTSIGLSAGKNQWTHFGVIGVPLRRGEFLRIGTDENLDWADVSGMVISVQVIGGLDEADQHVNVSIDEMKLVGGSGPDTSDPGLSDYDYRVTNVNKLTGDEGNPSDIMSSGVDSLRSAIVVNPAAFGNSNARQRFYRRGGTAVDNWYFVGENSSDGGSFTDRAADSEAIAGGAVETDNDQPVTTVDDDQNTVYGQPLPAMWLVGDQLFGCGDPNRSGFLYASKPGKYGSWPAANSFEVCPGSERLMCGFQWGGQGYVFSRERLYAILPNFGGSGSAATTPTACTHGIVNRWAFVVTRVGVFFVSWDGVYHTSGAQAENVTSGVIGELFNEDLTIPGYSPIDWNDLDAFRLAYHENEVWFFYKGLDSRRYAGIYSLQFKYWRIYKFPVNAGYFGYSEIQETGIRAFFIGERGGVFTHDDDMLADETINSLGVVSEGAIAYEWETGYLNQDAPKNKKLYGDFSLDMDRGTDTNLTSSDFTITFLYNNGVTVKTPSQTEGGGGLFGGTGKSQVQTSPQFDAGPNPGRQRYIYDLLDSQDINNQGPQYAHNVAVRVTGSSSTIRHSYFFGALSYAIQPDTIIKRATHWDPVGTLRHKWFKACIIEWEPDSNNFDPTRTFFNADIFGDNDDTPKASIRLVPTDDDAFTGGLSQRKVTQRAFPQFLAHHARVIPRGTIGAANFPVSIRIHNVQWIADEEPNYLHRWETQEVNHGIHGWHYPLHAWITVKGVPVGNVETGFIVPDIKLYVRSYTQYERRNLVTSVSNTFYREKVYTINLYESEQKRTIFVPFEAVRGVAHKYIFESFEPGSEDLLQAAFYLYREESWVRVMPWGSSEWKDVQPFGTDDLDLVRGAFTAEGIAVAGGGGRRQ